MQIGASFIVPTNCSISSAEEWTSGLTARASAAPAPDWSASLEAGGVSARRGFSPRVLLVALTFLMAVQSAFYSPAKYGYLKPLVGKARLAEGNGAAAEHLTQQEGAELGVAVAAAAGRAVAQRAVRKGSWPGGNPPVIRCALRGRSIAIASFLP